MGAVHRADGRCNWPSATLLPVVPLTLTMFSLQELLERLLKIVF